MNIIFVSQGSILDIFFKCAKLLKSSMNFKKIGFYVSNSLYFARFSSRYPEVVSENYRILKEWDITGFKSVKFNIDRINTFENEIGNPYLWGPLVADRRIFQGKLCKVRQDYTPRYSCKEMLSILDRALYHIDTFITEVEPDIIISFVPATFGEYLFYLFARAKSIPFLQLKTIKIENYVTLTPSIFEKPEHIYRTFEDYQKSSEEDKWTEKARRFLQEAEKGNLKYEGVIIKKKVKINPLAKIKETAVFMVKELKYLLGHYFKDPHTPGLFLPALYQMVVNPIKRKLSEKIYFKKSVTEQYLKKTRYVFYPLHTEPEIALSVYGRQYQNQIELIRNIAQNISVGMKLIVKEHPRSAGMRKLSYYRQLKQIPNVVLASSNAKTKILIKNAELIMVVSGSIGFEAAIMGKPVITFGFAPYNILPDSMVRKVKDIGRLDKEVKKAIEAYKYDEKSVVNYIASVMKESVPLDLYSLLLSKKNRYSFSEGTDSEKEKQLQRCAEYMQKRIKEEIEIVKENDS